MGRERAEQGKDRSSPPAAASSSCNVSTNKQDADQTVLLYTRNAVHLPPADFDAQLATAHRAASDAQAIVREMDKFEQADHISLAWVTALPCLCCAVMAVPIVAFLPTLGFHYSFKELASSE